MCCYTLFPYTTLFRSTAPRSTEAAVAATATRVTAEASGPRICSRKVSISTTFTSGSWEDSRSIAAPTSRSEEHTSELQSRGHLVCRLLLEKKKQSKQQ